jgi:hypothetical protein
MLRFLLFSTSCEHDKTHSSTLAKMTAEKGKGKARATGSEDPNITTEDDAPSMVSRITASANGLARSVLTSANNNESTTRTLASSTKGSSQSITGSGSSAWAESSKSSQPSYAQAGGAAGIKSEHSEEHVKASEEEFSSFLDGIDSFSSSEPSGTIGVDSYRDIGSTWGEAWARAQTIEVPEVIALDPTSKTVTQQENEDGQEVLDLLETPGWISSEFEAPYLDEDVGTYDWGLSPDQILQIRAMTRHLDLPEPQRSTDVDHPLNLIPNLDPEGRVQWIKEWEGVLTSYADEVWGGLMPLVKEARKEVEEIEIGGMTSEKPTALRRLEAILGHLQRR